MGALADSLPYLRLESDSLALADGAAVSSWTNTGWHGGALTQATAGNQPTYQTVETPTGEAAVLFDGTDDSLSKLSTTTGFLRQTVMAVVKPGGSGDRTILGTGGSQGIVFRVNASGLLEIKSGGAATYATGATVIPGTDFVLLTGTYAFTHKATASSTSGVSWPENALDGSTGTGWVAASAPSVGSPQWLEVELDTAAVVASINLTNATATTGPKDFTIEASNDGSTWTTLDTRVGLTWSGSTQTQAISYTNATAYLFYRINITATQGGGAPQIREFNLGVAFTPAATVRVGGALDGSGTPSGIPNNNTEARIGSHVNTTTGNFNGPIAFVARWDRVLRTTELAAVEAEVAAKYLGASVISASGTIAATSGVSGAITAQHVVGGTVAAVSTVSGDATLPATGSDFPASGTVAAVSGVSGAITSKRAVSGTVAAVSGVSGNATLAGAEPSQTLAGGFAFGSTLTTITAALQTGMSGGFAFGSRLKQSRTWSTDPRSTRPSPRVVITQRDGTPVLALGDVAIAPLDFRGVGVPDSWKFSIDRDDEAANIIEPGTHFAQLYRGDVLMSKGPIYLGMIIPETGRMTYSVSDPTWDMLERRRTIGRVPKLNWIVNGDFSQGLAGWRGSFDPGSAPEAAPVMEVVDEVESSSGKALRIEGVDKVVTNVANVETAAVFVANEATYLSGGAALVIAAAADIPDGATIHVVGHTADRRAYGDPGTGLALSLARAQAAKATLAAHNATWTFTLLPGLRTPNMNDGVSAGRGYYEQVAPNSNETDSAKNRRVALHYTSTQTATGHRQYALQTRYGVTNPVENLVEMPVTLTGRMIIEEWIGAPLDEWAMRLSLASMDGTVIDEATVTMTEKTPRQRIFDYDATVNVPADGELYWLGIRLYPPAGSSLWFDVNLYPHEQLGFFGIDQAHIIRDLVQHVQDPAMGKGDLGIGTRTTPTGIRRTMEFPFHERWPWSSAVEKITSLNRGVEVDCEMTPTSTTIVTYYPRQGSVASLPLTHGGQKSIVKAYRPIPSAGLASSVIVQGWGFGAARAERYARDEAAFGGALLEAVIEAEEGTPPGELDEVAVQKLARSIHPRAAWEVVLDPARTSEILDDIGKGDSSLLSLPDEGVHSLHRAVAWTWNPDTDGLTVQCAPEEG